MFKVGDRVYIREDLEMNKEDLPHYVGAKGVVVNTREINWSIHNILVEVLLDGDPSPKEWFSMRFGYCHNGTPDWEI